jgi:hypothetical protein
MGELDYIQKGESRVNGQYRFVSHDQVTAAIHPLLVKYGITCLPSVEEIKQEGNRTEVKLLVMFFNADCPTDNFAIKAVGYGIDPQDKGPGKAISYAYKYALLKTFCLETGEDPDEDQNTPYEPAKCLEFDSEVETKLGKIDNKKMQKFLEYSSGAMNKHVEDVKREALKRLPEFLASFQKWNPTKKEKA